jgi:WD40 repeat protein
MDRRRLAASSHKENDRYMRQFDGPPGSAPVARSSDLGRVGEPFEASEAHLSASFLPAVSRAWFDGPVDAAGTLVDLSERPVMCGAVDPERGITYLGCSDHATYAVSTETAKKAAVLYGKKAGHSEWVTSVAVMGDGSGRVVTAGMDAKIIVWAPPAAAAAGRARGAVSAAASQQCAVLTGHFGSVSAVACPGLGSGWGHVVVSAGYDKTLRVWDADDGSGGSSGAGSGGGDSSRHKLVGHGAPVLVLSVTTAGGGGVLAASGDRDGVACAWDCTVGRPLATLRGHRGHLTAVAWLTGDDSAAPAPRGASPPLLCTGAQDGHVRVWDLRSAAPVANVAVHTSGSGSGAVGELRFAAPCDGLAAGLVVTIGAGKRELQEPVHGGRRS